LSNDELLEILSEAKDPVAVQPFIKKCFEAVKELVFESNGEISGMISLEGEKIPFVENVIPATSGELSSQQTCPHEMQVRTHIGVRKGSTLSGIWSQCRGRRQRAALHPRPYCHWVSASLATPVCQCQSCQWNAGAVECWLLEVEGAIKRTMHSIAREALAAYAKSSRSSWILQWPGQLVLNCSQVSMAGNKPPSHVGFDRCWV